MKKFFVLTLTLYVLGALFFAPRANAHKSHNDLKIGRVSSGENELHYHLVFNEFNRRNNRSLEAGKAYYNMVQFLKDRNRRDDTGDYLLRYPERQPCLIRTVRENHLYIMVEDAADHSDQSSGFYIITWSVIEREKNVPSLRLPNDPYDRYLYAGRQDLEAIRAVYARWLPNTASNKFLNPVFGQIPRWALQQNSFLRASVVPTTYIGTLHSCHIYTPSANFAYHGYFSGDDFDLASCNRGNASLNPLTLTHNNTRYKIKKLYYFWGGNGLNQARNNNFALGLLGETSLKNMLPNGSIEVRNGVGSNQVNSAEIPFSIFRNNERNGGHISYHFGGQLPEGLEPFSIAPTKNPHQIRIYNTATSEVAAAPQSPYVRSVVTPKGKITTTWGRLKSR